MSARGAAGGEPILEVDALTFAYGDRLALDGLSFSVGRGEIFGQGLGNSVEKLHYLPEAHTDFILAVIGEELGLAGVCALIFIYFWVVQRCFSIGRRAIQLDRVFSGLFAQGIGLMLSILNAKFGDVQYIVAVVLGALYFLTPVLYPMSLLEGQNEILGWIIKANPMSWYVQAMHDVMYSLTAPVWWEILALLVGGADGVAAAIMAEAKRRNAKIALVRNGSRGLFWLEPMVEVETKSGRVAYGPVSADDVAGLFDDEAVVHEEECLERHGGQHAAGRGHVRVGEVEDAK